MFRSVRWPWFRRDETPRHGASNEAHPDPAESDALRNLPDAVLVLHPDGKVERAFGAVARVLGCSSNQVEDRRWNELVHPDDQAAAESAFRHAARAGSCARFRARWGAAAPQRRWVDGACAALLSNENAGKTVLSLREDARAGDYAGTDWAAQAPKMEALRRLAGRVAHDFNNMLMVIGGSVDMALDDSALPARLRSDLHEIKEASERATALARKLLTFSGRQSLDVCVVDLNSFLRGMEAELRDLLGDRGRLELCLSQGVANVRAEPQQLRHAIRDIVANAREAMSVAGVVSLSTQSVEVEERDPQAHDRDAARYVRLTVRDSGHGMPADVLAHMLEPFFTTKQTKGAGLSLCMAYGYFGQLGGHMGIESAPGLGTSVTVDLPVA